MVLFFFFFFLLLLFKNPIINKLIFNLCYIKKKNGHITSFRKMEIRRLNKEKKKKEN